MRVYCIWDFNEAFDKLGLVVGDDIVGVMPLPQGCGEAVRCGAGSDNEISASNMVSIHPAVPSTRPGKHRTTINMFLPAGYCGLFVLLILTSRRMCLHP